MLPIVSIVMPAYNSEKFILEAVDSVRRQTFTSWELIIVDDCSTDSTLAIAYKIAQSEPRIKIIENSKNIGAAASRNAGFIQCSGKYIALLDSDDLWEPDKLEKQIECAETTDADIVYCSYRIIDDQGKKKAPDYIVPERSGFNSMLSRSTISCSTALLKREQVQKYQFPTRMYHEDLAYWLLLLKNGATAVGVCEVLASYRVVPGSRAFNKARSAMNRWRIYRDYVGLSAIRSTILLFRYMFYGLIKYRKQA